MTSHIQPEVDFFNMKEYTKGNVAIEIDKDYVYIRRVGDTMTDHLFLSMQHLLDLRDLINQVLETPTVKGECPGNGVNIHTNHSI